MNDIYGDYLDYRVNKIMFRTYEYLEATGRNNRKENFSYIQYKIDHISEKSDDDLFREQELRYEYLLLMICGDDNFEIEAALLDLCIAAALIPEFDAYLKFYTGYSATAQLACEIEGHISFDYLAIVNILKNVQKVCFVAWDDPILPYASVSIDEQFMAFVLNGLVLDFGYEGIGEWFQAWDSLHPLFTNEDKKNEGLEIIKNGNVLQLSGNGGKRFIAKHIAMEANENLLLCDFDNLVRAEEIKRKNIFEKMLHGVCIFHGMICIYGITEENIKEIGEKYFYSEFVRKANDCFVPTILCTGSNIKFNHKSIFKIELPQISRSEREAVWKGFSDMYDIPLDAVRHSLYYNLTASEISEAVSLMRNRTDCSMAPLEWSKVCISIQKQKCDANLGNIIFPEITIDDVKMQENDKEVFLQALYYAKYGHLIYQDEKINHIYSYGRALSILFNGPSGTGKTMTAHAFANALGVPLYHIDLSQIADKYIGETEKHLENVFRYAEMTHMVLFFDEADAILGKRTLISDGNDRHSNMNVAYILQRIEHYDGIVILATNLKNNIDSAFIRRIKYIIQFELPDNDMRRQIWENCLPEKNNLSGDELHQIADRFKLSGGNIKNIVLSACVIAQNDSEPVGIKHIVRAAAQEYKKIGRLLTDLEGFKMYL